MLVGGALYFSAAEALCTHIYSLCSITNYRTDSLHIRGPISSGFYVGMADPVPNYSGLAAYFTFRHVAPTSLSFCDSPILAQNVNQEKCRVPLVPGLAQVIAVELVLRSFMKSIAVAR